MSARTKHSKFQQITSRAMKAKKGRSTARVVTRPKRKGFGSKRLERAKSRRDGEPDTKLEKRDRRFQKQSLDSAADEGGKALMTLALHDLKRSGLDKSDFRKLELEVLSRDETEEFVGEPRASYKIPYFDLVGKRIAYSRVRFLENAKKKFNKRGKDGSFRYSQPFNSSPHVYFPPYFNWKKIANDPTQKILITEGEKKAATACKHGIACIALGGVYGFKSQKRMIGLLPELEAFEWNKRAIEVCYDADVMMKSEVRQALSALAMTLTQNYSAESLDFVFLDAETAGSKTGLDDYLAEHGAEGFEKLPRQAFRAQAKLSLLNTKVCFVKSKAQFFDIETGKYFKNLNHLREAYMNEGEEMVDGKRAVFLIDLWAKSATRRTVMEVLYEPGRLESDAEKLNLWRPAVIQPKKGNVKRWLDLIHYIFREPQYAEYFLKWLAYPVQNLGAKLLQAPFVYGKKQGIGKTFVVDPIMEFIYGDSNFHRLGNNDVTSVYNEYVGCKQMVVTNEIYLPDYSDRNSAMGTLKDMITREKVTVNEKFQPRVSYVDHCNYYFTSNHADALVLEPDDRRFFVVEAPDKPWDQGTYKELDHWVRHGDGGSVILHYLQNYEITDYEPKGAAMMTPWKKSIISLSRDSLGEFGERLLEDTDNLFMVNGNMPDLQLFRAADLLKVFEHTYPKYRFNVTIARMGRILDNPKIEKRSVRVNSDAPLQTLYALFERDTWRKKRNVEWSDHYTANSKIHGARSRH